MQTNKRLWKDGGNTSTFYLTQIPMSHMVQTHTHDMVFSPRIVKPISKLDSDQKATVKTYRGLTDLFNIEQGVSERCIMLTHLFNIHLYSEMVVRISLEILAVVLRVTAKKKSKVCR